VENSSSSMVISRRGKRGEKGGLSSSGSGPNPQK
jgi:hypothetical protein